MNHHINGGHLSIIGHKAVDYLDICLDPDIIQKCASLGVYHNIRISMNIPVKFGWIYNEFALEYVSDVFCVFEWKQILSEHKGDKSGKSQESEKSKTLLSEGQTSSSLHF